jgi:hypothetical protein
MEQSTIEAAFSLARSGSCVTVDEVERVLRQNGYSSVVEHLRSPTLRRQLRAALAEAQRAEMNE